MSRAAAALTIFLFACSGSPDAGPLAPIGGEVLFAKPAHTASWTPVSFAVFNACSGETVSVDGAAHTTTRIWTEGDRVLVKGHTNLNLSGVGQLSGRNYRLIQLTNTATTIDITTGGSEAEQVHHLSMISGGGMPNAHVTMNGTLVVDGSGNSTVVPKKWDSTCR
jgi:hypothetical protein